MMPNSCAVFGCKIPVFKLPTKPDDLRHRWLQVHRRDDLQSSSFEDLQSNNSIF